MLGSGDHSIVFVCLLCTHMMSVGTEIVRLSRGKLSLGEENMVR